MFEYAAARVPCSGDTQTMRVVTLWWAVIPLSWPTILIPNPCQIVRMMMGGLDESEATTILSNVSAYNSHLSVKCIGLSPWKWRWQNPNIVHSPDVWQIALNCGWSPLSSWGVQYWTVRVLPGTLYSVLTSPIFNCRNISSELIVGYYQCIDIYIWVCLWDCLYEFSIQPRMAFVVGDYVLDSRGSPMGSWRCLIICIAWELCLTLQR
jgi:hypothetical protein